MTIDPDYAAAVYEGADCLYSEQEVQAAFDRMAVRINVPLAGADPIVLCVMTGGIVLTGQLLPRLHFALQLDYVHATRYRRTTRGGALDWRVAQELPLRDRKVLVIDDILDEGFTLAAVVKHCTDAGAREVLSAVLISKIHDRRIAGCKADFIGLEVPDRYIFGFGMDYKGYLRNAPGIFAVGSPG